MRVASDSDTGARLTTTAEDHDLSRTGSHDMVRIRAVFQGVVQGVGFRPAMYRLAMETGVTGFVTNTPGGALLEAEGSSAAVETLTMRLRAALPPRASLHSLEITRLDPVGYASFEIRESVQTGERLAHVPPDIATCKDCLREMADPSDRRYRYPFTNCTNCGPRYSIITALPYDRPHTTMDGFIMCADCRREYEDPLDRRFHAQPNACPRCGPAVELWAPDGNPMASGDDAIVATVEAITAGRIVAVKGLGGFHLLARADSDAVVQELRTRKRREEKPLAIMCPSLEMVHSICEVDPFEELALTGPEHPIVLLRRRVGMTPGSTGASLSHRVAPHNPCFGVMLPYTPLHHLLLAGIGLPVVATSGNVSDEPICTDEREALIRLKGLADLFLVHNRPICRHVDDSIVRIIGKREQVLRRARGFAPLPVPIAAGGSVILAVGAHLKNSVALAVGDSAYISQHIGDLDTAPARAAHERVMRDLQTLREVEARVVACDRHPDYASTLAAQRLGHDGALVVPVQHHVAHVLSCMADNGLEPPVLGVSWDGTGLGDDGTIWGGEFILVADRGETRVAHLRPFRLPGGDAAMREPRRSALGLLYAVFGDAALEMLTTDNPHWDRSSAPVLMRMIQRGVNAPLTTSAGRLFDAVASIIGLRHVSRFEGQAAMELEWLVGSQTPPEPYIIPVVKCTTHGHRDDCLVLDWEPMLRSLLRDVAASVSNAAVARGFHRALAVAIREVAVRLRIGRVVMSGGCFQNRILSETAEEMLTRSGFRAYVHQRVPPNDGGIALGQLAAARRAMSGARLDSDPIHTTHQESHGGEACVSQYPEG